MRGTSPFSPLLPLPLPVPLPPFPPALPSPTPPLPSEPVAVTVCPSPDRRSRDQFAAQLYAETLIITWRTLFNFLIYCMIVCEGHS